MLIRLEVINALTVEGIVGTAARKDSGTTEVFVLGKKRIAGITDNHYVQYADTMVPPRRFFSQINALTTYERRRGRISRITYFLREYRNFLVIDIGIQAMTKHYENKNLENMDFFDFLMARITSETNFRVEIQSLEFLKVSTFITNVSESTSGRKKISLWPGQNVKDMFEEGNRVLEGAFKFQSGHAFPYDATDTAGAGYKAIRRLFYETNLGRFLSHWANDGGPLRPIE